MYVKYMRDVHSTAQHTAKRMNYRVQPTVIAIERDLSHIADRREHSETERPMNVARRMLF